MALQRIAERGRVEVILGASLCDARCVPLSGERAPRGYTHLHIKRSRSLLELTHTKARRTSSVACSGDCAGGASSMERAARATGKDDKNGYAEWQSGDCNGVGA